MTTGQASKLLTKANTALVRYPRFNELHEDIRLCQEMSRLAGEPQCMVLEGMTGTGKTTLIQAYVGAFSRYETSDGTKIPIFYMETPSPVTVKGMAARMLEVMGDPAAHRGSLWSMNARLIRFIQACEVQLVILDDFHHLIDKDTDRVLETVSDWLKVLIKETNVPFLVVGIEGVVDRILQANQQLSRLFAARETLAPFGWDLSDEGTMAEFAAFVKYVEMGIGMALPNELPRTELLHRLHYVTEGVVGNVMNLMRYAALLAQKQGTGQLTLSILGLAFDKRLRKHMAGKINSFTVDAGRHFVAPQAAAANMPGSTNHRSKRSKKREPTAADVLTTG
jgi:hypothetical protein